MKFNYKFEPTKYVTAKPRGTSSILLLIDTAISMGGQQQQPQVTPSSSSLFTTQLFLGKFYRIPLIHHHPDRACLISYTPERHPARRLKFKFHLVLRVPRAHLSSCPTPQNARSPRKFRISQSGASGLGCTGNYTAISLLPLYACMIHFRAQEDRQSGGSSEEGQSLTPMPPGLLWTFN